MNEIFNYNIIYDGCCLRSFESTEEDFDEEFKNNVDSIVEDWLAEGCYDNQTYEDFIATKIE